MFKSTSRLRGADEYELAAHEDGADDEAAITSLAPPTTSFVPFRFHSALLPVVLIIIVIYSLLTFVYSDPTAWPSSAGSLIIAPTVVRAAGVKYQGSRRGLDQFISFLAIPYAQTTSGEGRFRTARTFDKGSNKSEQDWKQVNITQASTPDTGCPRLDPDDPTKQSFLGTEDCLKLNIYTPQRREEGVKLPVLLWIHGGGYYAGFAGETKYSPRDLIHRSISMNTPIVFVSVNYRLGTLGFSSVSTPAGPPPRPPHNPYSAPRDFDLNVGLKDQLAAMRWVRQEIGNFGGDPDKVTLVGASAGAMSAGLHQCYSPAELFRGVFMMSGAPTSFPVPWPHEGAARTLEPLAASSGCPGPTAGKDNALPDYSALVNCLRSLPLDLLMRASKILLDRAAHNAFFPWSPVLEGDFDGGKASWLSTRPSSRIMRGLFNKVPIIMGSVRDEGTRFTGMELKSEGDIIQVLQGIFTYSFGSVQTILTPLLAFYPDDPVQGSPFSTSTALFGLSSSYKRAAAIINDLLFDAPRRHFLRETPKDWGTPSWNYRFDQKQRGDAENMGVRHGVDQVSWFAHPKSSEEEDLHLSRHMASYLINFVVNLDPNGPGLRDWPQYGVNRKTLRLVGHNIDVIQDDDRLEAMSFINKNNPIFNR